MNGARALIALDWGTSRLRASLVSADGQLIESRASSAGIMHVAGGQFEEALRELCADWLQCGRYPVLASGMIGSRNGWREAPYLRCPAGLDEASRQAVTLRLQGGGLMQIAPGLTCVGADGVDDVMRGEETQIWGAQPQVGSCVILPGTHSKWALMGPSCRIEFFQTWLTGELYALWTEHGILGRLMRFGAASPEDFAAGVRLGLAEFANAHHVLFAARTAGLLGRIEPEGLPDYLSGLLIGIEIGAATCAGSPFAARRSIAAPLREAMDVSPPFLLIGDAELCGRYATALAIAGWPSARADDAVTLKGQWRLACAAGLMEAEG
jgi:2-dehydro-3-deoxygalactonokinase